MKLSEHSHTMATEAKGSWPQLTLCTRVQPLPEDSVHIRCFCFPGMARFLLSESRCW